MEAATTTATGNTDAGDSLLFNMGMLNHSPEKLVLRNHAIYLNDFDWNSLDLQEPLQTPSLCELGLKGVPAITFHPHSLLPTVMAIALLETTKATVLLVCPTFSLEASRSMDQWI